MKRLIKRVLLSKVMGFSQSIFNFFKSRVIGNSGVVEAESCAVTTLSNLDARNLLQSATFVLAPSGYKSGVIYSQVPSNGNGDLTVTRATSATRVNSSGAIETVASGVPQLDYSLGGCPNFLFEPLRTNNIKYSQDFTQSNWTKSASSIGSNTATAPDNSIAYPLLENTSSTIHQCFQSVTSGITGANNHTATLFVKQHDATNRNIGLRIQDNAFTYGSIIVVFNPSNGSLVTSSTSVNGVIVGTPTSTLINGWYRIQVVFSIASSTAFRNDIVLYNGTNILYSGNDPNTTPTGVYIFGYQLETGSGTSASYPTSYIPTTSAAVTRNVTSFTRSNIYTNGLIGASGGTWFVELKNNLNTTRDAGGMGLYLGTTTSVTNTTGFRIVNFPSPNYASIFVSINGITTQYNTLVQNSKICIKWDSLGNAKIFLNGDSGTSTISLGTCSFDNLGCLDNGVIRYISQMALWNTPLSDAQCAALTS